MQQMPGKLFRPRTKAEAAYQAENESLARRAYRRHAEMLNPSAAVQILDSKGRPRGRPHNLRIR